MRLQLPPEMADALAWADMVGKPGRPRNLLPYRYLPDGGKRPAVDGWERWHGGGGRLDAQPVAVWTGWARLAERTRIRTWATLPGALGVVVVDVDAPHLLGHALDTYGETPVGVHTPRGGTHLYYRAPDDVQVPTRAGVLGPGSYDVRSVGGTAHAPGSQRPDGATYRAEAPGLNDGALRDGSRIVLSSGALYALLPPFDRAVLDREWLTYHPPGVDLPRDGEPRYATTAEEIDALRAYVRAAGPAVSGHGGHDHTFRLLRKIGDLGASEELALELALEWDASNEPPWGERSIKVKVKDAYRRRQAPVGWRLDELEGEEAEGQAMSVDELVAAMDAL